jgi:tetratricopeptide (TPR) repeat protein
MTMNQGLTALARRDQALAELDRGDAGRARAIASQALVLLATGGQGESSGAAALLVALAETDECLDRFDLARAAAGRAAAILAVFDSEDLDAFWLWCQAEERLAGLDRVGGDLDGAAARLADLIDRAVRMLGPVSEAVVSAENALGVVHKYAGHFDDAAAAYGRALCALQESGRRDPLAEASLYHNLGGLACSQGNPDAGIPHAEQGLVLRIEAIYLLDALSFLLYAPLLLVIPARPGAAHAGDPERRTTYREVLRNRNFLWLWALSALVVTVSYGMDSAALPAFAIRPGGISPPAWAWPLPPTR